MSAFVTAIKTTRVQVFFQIRFPPVFRGLTNFFGVLGALLSLESRRALLYV